MKVAVLKCVGELRVYKASGDPESLDFITTVDAIQLSDVYEEGDYVFGEPRAAWGAAVSDAVDYEDIRNLGLGRPFSHVQCAKIVTLTAGWPAERNG